MRSICLTFSPVSNPVIHRLSDADLRAHEHAPDCLLARVDHLQTIPPFAVDDRVGHHVGMGADLPELPSAVRNRPQAVFIASGWSISSSVLVSVTICSSNISTVIPPSQKPEHPSLRPLLPFQFDPLPAAQVGDRDLLVVNLENAPELAVRRRDDASRLD